MPHLLRLFRWPTLLLGVAIISDPAPAAAQEAPTFTKDVAPIFFKNCVVCHKPGEAVPMSLITYENARPWARSIKRRVVAREMPPWFADPQYGHFSNDRRLSQQEIDTIAAWVDAGAPKGRDQDMPAVPTFAKGWRHPSGKAPDAVVEMPVEFNAPPTGEIPYTTFYTPVPFAGDTFVEATQVRPGNHAFVHHVIVRAQKVSAQVKVDPTTGLLVDAQTGKVLEERREEDIPANTAARQERANAEPVTRPQDVFDTSSTVWLATYAPGWDFDGYKPEVGKRIPSGWHIGFNMHYQATGKPESDRTGVGLWFPTAPVRHEVATRFIGESYVVEGKQLLETPRRDGPGRGRSRIPNIPPHVDSWAITGITPVIEPIAIYSFNPHMHLRGKSMKYVVVYPDGQEETLFNVPKYDFNWQVSYQNSEPVRIPAGSKIMTVGVYDNSVKNKFNPAPDREVFWSEQSWDEMFQGFIQFTKDTNAAATPKSQPKGKSTSKAKAESTVSQR